MTSPPYTSSVIIRSKNSARTIGATLEAMARQTVRPEIVVVDSGSTDGTLDIAHDRCDVLVTIRPEEFSYGGALNRGAARAAGQILFALSSHCVPASDQWVEWSLEAYRSDRIAATFGQREGPDGRPLPEAMEITSGEVAGYPFWGLSNHASSWHRSVWEQFAFRTDLEACEDLDWMWRVLDAGFCLIADPRLWVATGHRRAAGLRALFARVCRERAAVAQLVDYPTLTLGDAVSRWYSLLPPTSTRPHWQRRLSPYRTIELAGEYWGDRIGSRRRNESTRPFVTALSPPEA